MPARVNISALCVPNAPTPIIKTCFSRNVCCPTSPIEGNNICLEYLSCIIRDLNLLVDYSQPHVFSCQFVQLQNLKDPVKMSEAMKLAVEAGRLGFEAGRIDKKIHAVASSTQEGLGRV